LLLRHSGCSCDPTHSNSNGALLRRPHGNRLLLRCHGNPHHR
jgi:hypothetical protein